MSAEPRFPHLPAETWALHLDDALEGAARDRVEAHLDGCAECRAVLLSADPSRAFRALREPPPPSWDGFWEELQPELGPAPILRARKRARLTWALGAAASLVLASLVAMSWRSDEGHQQARIPEACDPVAVASLRMTREECEALHAGPILDPDPEIVVIDGLDLRGL